MKDLKVKERYNMPVTILLILGLVTIIFPLYRDTFPAEDLELL